MKIYIVNCNSIVSEEQINSMYSLVSEEKKNQANKYHFKKDAIRCLMGELLTRYCIAINFNINPYSFFINKTVSGKPFIVNYPNINFNISHSGEWVACAVSPNPIGIDIEKTHNVDYLTLSRRYFSNDEHNYIIKIEESQRPDIFFTLWTIKESFLKLTGEGLSRSLNSFIFDFNSHPSSILSVDKNNILAYVHCYTIEHDYKLSVCCYEYVQKPKIIQLQFNSNNSNALLDMFSETKLE